MLTEMVVLTREYHCKTLPPKFPFLFNNSENDFTKQASLGHLYNLLYNLSCFFMVMIIVFIGSIILFGHSIPLGKKKNASFNITFLPYHEKSSWFVKGYCFATFGFETRN